MFILTHFIFLSILIRFFSLKIIDILNNLSIIIIQIKKQGENMFSDYTKEFEKFERKLKQIKENSKKESFNIEFTDFYQSIFEKIMVKKPISQIYIDKSILIQFPFFNEKESLVYFIHIYKAPFTFISIKKRILNFLFNKKDNCSLFFSIGFYDFSNIIEGNKEGEVRFREPYIEQILINPDLFQHAKTIEKTKYITSKKIKFI